MATSSKKNKPVAKKAATSKKVSAKPAKKVVTKKVAEKPAAAKAAAKKVAPKKVEKPSKGSSSKKTTSKVAATKVKTSKKVDTKVEKADSKSSAKKITSPKTETKTAKKLSSKKIAVKKEAKPKVTAVKKATPEKKSIKTADAGKVIKESTKHQELLKKAVKAKKAEEKKVEKKEKPFVMPQIKTDKARKYTPSFTKSILDQPVEKPMGPTLRYSDPDLQEFKELITRKLLSAKKELTYLQGLITRKDQMGGDESDNRYMTMEDGSLSMEREQLSQMASRQITFIDHLEKALVRIENKTYGICRVTGKLIDKARLRAVPHATLSIEAKMGIAK